MIHGRCELKMPPWSSIIKYSGKGAEIAATPVHAACEGVNCVGSSRGLMAALLLLCALGPASAQHAEEAEHEAESNAFQLYTHRTWFFRSFPDNAEDDNNTLGLEFVSGFGLGNYNVTNIAYLELADYETPVPGFPIGNPDGGTAAATGINDLLTAFLISRKGEHHGPHHFSLGFAAQFPTGDSEALSSGKYSLGPAVDYEYSGDRLFMAFVALQLWSVAGDENRKDVNMMMIKPMITYDLQPKWKAVYMPYGVSVYWDKPAGQRVYFPLGGGIQRQFDIGNKSSAFSMQYFYNVVAPDKGVKQDLRFMFEVNF
jgi:hypothetical protein